MTSLTQTAIDGLIRAVREAAKTEILPRFRNLAEDTIKEKKGPTDLVTEADLASEKYITEAARALLPDALIVGEEAVEEDPSILDQLQGADLAVIIDPVDGTYNFASGLAVFGVILSVVEHGEVVFGLLYDPVMDDWVMATKGGGAWFCQANGSRRRLTGPTAKPQAEAQAYVSTYIFPKENQPEIVALLPSFRRVNSLRCSCHEYRMFALGWVDLLVSAWVKPWDHAAGMLVAAECGAVVTSGGKPGYRPADAQAPLVVYPQGADWVEALDWAQYL